MYWVFKGTVLTMLRIWFRPKVEGSRDLPAGPVIVASNHLSFSDTFSGLPEDPAVLRSVTDEIMRELQRLSGQEYVDSYSPGPARRGAAAHAR